MWSACAKFYFRSTRHNALTAINAVQPELLVIFRKFSVEASTGMPWVIRGRNSFLRFFKKVGFRFVECYNARNKSSER